MMMRRAVFVDRDGVINANRSDHVKGWDEFVFLPGALDALVRIAGFDLQVVVTTNQAAIHRNLVTEATVQDIHARMTAAVQKAGGRIDAIYYCPHTPEENCACRKPRPGMYLEAARQLDLDLARSFVVGDTRRDVEAAAAIGARPILVQTGIGCDRLEQPGCAGCAQGCLVVDDLMAAVEWIYRQEQGAL